MFTFNKTKKQIKKGLFLLLSVLFLGSTFAATSTITVTFDQTPSQVSVQKAPLKYNKDFAYSYEYDDGYSEGYHIAYKYLNGGTVDQNSTVYPGLYYTDGAGNDIPFAGGFAITSLNGAGNDIHFNGALAYIDWNEMDETYEAGWNILNHGYNADNIITYTQDIISGSQYIYDNTLNHILPQHLIVPNGLTGYIPYTFDAGMKSVARQGIDYFFDGEEHRAPTTPLIVNNLDVTKHYQFRKYYNDEDWTLATITQDVDQMFTNSSGTDKLWRQAFSHKVLFDGDLQGHISWTKWKYLMDHVASNYGKNGNDSVWFVGPQDVYEYIGTRNAVTLQTGLVNTTLTIQINSDNVDPDYVRKSLSLLVDAQGANITSIDYGNGDFNHHSENLDDGLVNVEWGLVSTGNLFSKVEYYVAQAESNRGETAINLGQTWINFLETGTQKTAFQNRLDAIVVRGQTRQISVGKFSNVIGIWNSYNGYLSGASVLNNLKNTDEEVTNLSIGISQRFTNRLDGQTTLVDGEGVYPNTVMERGLSLYGNALDPASGIVVISGLNTDNTYDFTLFGSTVKDYNDNRTITIYNIGGVEKELTIKQNTSNTIVYTGISPDIHGNVYIIVSQKEPVWGYAILSSIVIDENLGTGSSTPIVDTTKPIGTITYSTTSTISGNVTATLSMDEQGTITNNGGSSSYIFTDNGSFTFEFQDLVGNTGKATAFVTWIDRLPSDITAAETVQISVGKFSNTIGIWNSYNNWDDPLKPSLDNLQNTNGEATSISISIAAPFYSRYLGQTGAVDGDGIYPNAVLERGLAMYGDSNATATGTVKISGLNPITKYTFKLFGSTYRNYVDDRTITIYNIGGVNKELIIRQNIQDIVTYTDIYPDTNGDVYIDVAKKFLQYGYGMLNAIVVEEQSDAIDYVPIPNSSNLSSIETEFTNRGYTKGTGALRDISIDTLVGNKKINFSNNAGGLLVPTVLKSKNSLTEVYFPQGAVLKKGGVGFTGILETPTFIDKTTISNLNNVIAAVRIGDGTVGSLLIKDGSNNAMNATLRIPAPGTTIGSKLNVYYSEDHGSTWTLHGNYTVTSIGGQSYVEFTTNHFTDFAILDGIGSFTINNDAASTTSQTVTLNISTTPPASQMRFSNDNSTRSDREPYATSTGRTLTAGYGNKVVYAEFDADGNGTSDAQTSDEILYSEPSGGGSCPAGSSCGDLKLRIITGHSYCQYGTTLDFGTTGLSYDGRSLITGFVTTGGDAQRFCEDKQGLGTRALTIQSSDLVNTSTNVAAQTIPASRVFIKNPAAYIPQGEGVCTFSSGDSLDQRINLSGAKEILGKVGLVGEGCKIMTDNLSLKVDLIAAQAIGQYSGTITINVPNF